MCIFYKVSRSGYYSWLKRDVIENNDDEIIKLIQECHSKNKKCYGYRRVTKWLKKVKGIVINKKRILRIMTENNLLSVIRRKKPFKYKYNGNLCYENLMDRNFTTNIPNEKWVTDISYIIVPEGTLYLSAIRDLCGNFIVSHKMAKRQDYSLVKRTIDSAISSENSPKGVMIHSDGGGQYRSWDYRFQTNELGLVPSMSKPATPGDNACAENFFSILKTECIYIEKPKTLLDAERLIDEFVQYYNYERIQGNGLTPFEERQLAM